jgi:hypothetical protein
LTTSRSPARTLFSIDGLGTSNAWKRNVRAKSAKTTAAWMGYDGPRGSSAGVATLRASHASVARRP